MIFKSRNNSINKFFLIPSLLILYTFHWTFMTYRTKPWFYSTNNPSNINEFKGIRLTKETSSIAKYFQEEFRSELNGEKLLITGRVPFLYFILGASPATCMSFFHSLPKKNYLKTFKNCLDSKSPNKILSIIPFETKEIYIKENQAENDYLTNPFFNKLLFKTAKIISKSKYISRKYIIRRPLGKKTSEIHPYVNKFITEYVKSNDYISCRTKSIPKSIVDDMHFIYPNAIKIDYRICSKNPNNL